MGSLGNRRYVGLKGEFFSKDLQQAIIKFDKFLFSHPSARFSGSELIYLSEKNTFLRDYIGIPFEDESYYSLDEGFLSYEDTELKKEDDLESFKRVVFKAIKTENGVDFKICSREIISCWNYVSWLWYG